MFGLAPSAMEEGAKGPQNGPKGRGGPKGPLALRRSQKEGRGAYLFYILEKKNNIMFDML